MNHAKKGTFFEDGNEVTPEKLKHVFHAVVRSCANRVSSYCWHPNGESNDRDGLHQLLGISYEEVDKREGTPGKKHHDAKNGGDQLDKVCDELVGIFNPNGKTNLRDIRQVKRIISTYLKQALEQLGGMQVGYLLSSAF